MGERMSLVAWMMAIGASVAALVISAALRPGNLAMGYLHMAVAAGASIFFALYAINSLQSLAKARSSQSKLAAETVRSQGLVWTWAALVIAVTYGTGVLNWKEWVTHFAGIFAIGSICLAVAATLDKAAAGNTDDTTMIKLARALTIGQLVGMLLLVVGFLIDGQMKRFLVERYTDWPAKHVMFFGAVTIAAICGAAITYLPGTSKR